MRGVDLMETSDQISRAEEQTNEVIAAGPGVGPSVAPSTGPNVVRRRHGRSLVSKLRLGSWNIETLTGELVKIFEKRRVDIACIQENKWAGNRVWEIDGWKVWYSGESKSRNGVGVIVGEKLRDQVVRVEHRNDWLMRVKLVIEGSILNVISAYAPQESLGEEVKRRFWNELGDMVRGFPKTEHFVVGGDFNGHIGRSRDGYSDAHGGFGFGDRNDSGLALLEFSVSFGCVIANSLFRKKDAHLITFESTTCSSQNNYFVLRREDRKRCRDCKVIPYNGLTIPHRLLLLDFDLPHSKRKKNNRTQAAQPRKRTSWWNEEVRVKLKAKKMAYRSLRTSTSEEERERRLVEYKMAKKEAKRVVAKAQEGETIKSTQLKSGARVKVAPLHPPPGDTSTERSVYINDVMSGNRPKTYSCSTSYTQATYPQSGGWAPQGQPPVHHQQQAGYGYDQQGGYAMPLPYYSGYPPPQASWDQTNPSTVPPQPQQAMGYNTYGQQPPVPPPSVGNNYNHVPPSSYNYNQGYAQQPPYGQDTAVFTEQQKPYANPNSAYSQPPPLSSQPVSIGQTSHPDAGTGYAQQGAPAPTDGYNRTYPGYGAPPASYNQGGGYQQMGYGQQQGAAQAGPIQAPYPYYGQGAYPPPPAQANYYQGGYPAAPGQPPVQGQYGVSQPPSYGSEKADDGRRRFYC